MERRLAAILMTDIVDYSRPMGLRPRTCCRLGLVSNFALWIAMSPAGLSRLTTAILPQYGLATVSRFPFFYRKQCFYISDADNCSRLNLSRTSASSLTT